MARILIIDDSPSETAKFKEILTRHGHQILEATNGADGVAMARETLPDVILMDVVMPVMNGFQATRQISRLPETAHIPIIIVSTKDQETDQVWGKRQGASDYLTKPVSEAMLTTVLNRILQS